MNIPFQRKSGIEITKSKPYLHISENRKQRRKKEPPFIANGKNYPLTVSGTTRYVRYIQRIGNKIILHYLPC